MKIMALIFLKNSEMKHVIAFLRHPILLYFTSNKLQFVLRFSVACYDYCK